MPETQPISVASCPPIAQDRQAFEDAAAGAVSGSVAVPTPAPGDVARVKLWSLWRRGHQSYRP